MKRKRTASASPRDTPTKPSSTTAAPTLSSIPLNLPAETASSNTPTRPLPLPETPGKQRRTTLLHPEQPNGTGLGTGTDSVHSPSPQKRLRTPMTHDGNSTGVRFAESVLSPGDAIGGPVTNADRSARRKSVRRIVSKAIGGGEDSDGEDEDEEDVLARKIFGDDDSDDIDGGLLADEEAIGVQKKRSRRNATTALRKKKKQLVEEEITAPTDGPDSYFFQNRKARLVTSNSTLASLPVLDHSSYFRLIREHGPDHVEDRAYLEGLHRQNFPQWEFELSQGFNLLLYGYGSKRNLLMQFAKRIYRSPRSLVVINGYVPTLTIKDVLTTVAKAIIDPNHTIRLGSNPSDTLDTILSILDTHAVEDQETEEEEGEYGPITHLTILIHNLDGEPLRTTRAQALLARLSSHPKISLVASIDHIRAPLLWDAARVSQFNFLWHDATTFVPYSVESSIDDSLALISGSGRAGGTKGVKFVLASLPMNAKSLYRVLISHQLQGIEDGAVGAAGEEEVGVEYKVLYQKAVEEFICSNDMAFRTLLKEFQDHQMVSLKKDAQGTDVLWAPFKKEELETILEDLVA